MRPEGRVPYGTVVKATKKPKKASASQQEAPGADEYRRDLRRQKQIYKMLRDRHQR